MRKYENAKLETQIQWSFSLPFCRIHVTPEMHRREIQTTRENC